MECNQSQILAVTAIVGGLVAILALYRWLQQKTKPKKAVPRGAVLLHAFPRGHLAVVASPFCMKLETFMRMAKIPYEKDSLFMRSSKTHKVPWIEYNGQTVNDSKLCIHFLTKEFEVDMDNDLTPEQRGIGRCVATTLEENAFWAMVYYRWFTNGETIADLMLGWIPTPFRYWLFRWRRRTVASYMYGHGIGRHSEQDIFDIAVRDLRAVSAILGDKQYLFGSKPSSYDAAVFGVITAMNAFDMASSPLLKVIKTELTNLWKHNQRMKKVYYPDWDQITSKE